MEEITITKKISKMGDNHILIIPKDLKEQIQANDLVEVKIRLISRQQKITPKKSTKKPDKKILQIVSHLKQQGYDTESIKAVMKKNGYNIKDIDNAVKSL